MRKKNVFLHSQNVTGQIFSLGIPESQPRQVCLNSSHEPSHPAAVEVSSGLFCEFCRKAQCHCVVPPGARQQAPREVPTWLHFLSELSLLQSQGGPWSDFPAERDPDSPSGGALLLAKLPEDGSLRGALRTTKPASPPDFQAHSSREALRGLVSMKSEQGWAAGWSWSLVLSNTWKFPSLTMGWHHGTSEASLPRTLQSIHCISTDLRSQARPITAEPALFLGTFLPPKVILQLSFNRIH